MNELQPERGGRIEVGQYPEKVGRWFVVEVTRNGNWPLAGPFKRRGEALDARKRIEQESTPDLSARDGLFTTHDDHGHALYLFRRIQKAHPRA